MSSWLVGPARTAGFVAVTTALVYASTVLALRFGERRTLAELSTFDFVVAVAVGAIVGRTATTENPTYLQGMVAIVTLLAAHHAVGALRRRWPRCRRFFEKPPVVLVEEGRVCGDALARTDMTIADVAAKLREQGVTRLDEVQLAVLEPGGGMSVLGRDGTALDDTLRSGLP